ncbi:MAG TPA: MerR family transcriptional regulator [Acidimicrobiales bacterium]|nr:MerR family transcriptional regulator [Acidimicrobiales bacterium]
MTERSYLSIGDVLNLLKEEFPDVTISKIRFLESQGLLDPERTPSGYRKFYPPDVDRLRWILLQQKEHFLPLKVIKDRLVAPEGGELGPEAEAGSAGEPDLASKPAGRPAPALVASTGRGRAGAGGDTVIAPAVPVPNPASSSPAPARPLRSPALPPAAARLPVPAPDAPEDPAEEAISLTLEELLARTGLAAAEARELERFGLISGRSVAGTVYYDSDATAVAHLAAELSHYGVEARHLRMYKTAAEREAGFFEQIVTPLLKQRNPRSRQEAVETVHTLSALGERLRRSLLRMALRDLTGG